MSKAEKNINKGKIENIINTNINNNKIDVGRSFKHFQKRRNSDTIQHTNVNLYKILAALDEEGEEYDIEDMT